LDDVDEDRAAPSEAELEALAGIVGLGSAVSDAVSSALDDVLGGLADAAQDDEAAPEPESFAEAIWDTDELSDEMSDAADVSEDAATEPPGVEAVFSTLRFAHREPEPAAPAELSALASRIAELEAAVAESADDEWEPDGAGEGDNAGAPVDALSWEDADDAQGSHAWEADPLEAAEDAELAEPEPDFAAEPELTAEPAFDAEPEPEPDLDDRWADPHLARDIDPEADLFAETDSVIDEDMLRDLIADIVRRELQGTLGERITRNVRKLVRREIHRALSARELD
jgi:hypothetical protein